MGIMGYMQAVKATNNPKPKLSKMAYRGFADFKSLSKESCSLTDETGALPEPSADDAGKLTVTFSVTGG